MKNGFITGFQKGMGEFSANITTLVNTLLLAVVYIIGIGITAIIAKIFRKRFLEMEMPESSYWSGLNLSRKQAEDYYKQF